MSKILIAEDDADIADNVRLALKTQQHSCEVVLDGKSALDLLNHFDYDLVILDWQMPEMTGIEVLRQHRQKGGKTPILMLTGKSDIPEKVEGLDAGADDYITKPFNLTELMARVRALLRRPGETSKIVLSYGNMCFDTIGRRLLINDKEVELSALEIQVMEYFLRRPSMVVSQEDLVNKVWTSEACATDNAVYACIKSLRKKLVGSAATPFITTIYGLGYKLDLKT